MYNSQHIITLRHYLALLIIAFAAGIFLAAQLGFLKALLVIIISIITCSVIIFVYFALHKHRFTLKAIILPILLTLTALLGIFRLFIAESPSTNHLAAYKNTEAWVFGTVSSEPRYIESSHSYSFELDVFCINDNTSANGTVIMYIPQSHGCNASFGDAIRCWTKLSGSTSSTDSLSEDYYTRLKGRNIFLSGNTKNINILDKSFGKTPMFYLKSLGNLFRAKICKASDFLLNEKPQSAAILKGILVGDKSGFDNELYEKLSNAGISHIVAVSGLHISILFSFLLLVMSGLNFHSRLRLVAVVPFILLFMAASSFTPSVCRASLMMLIMILSSLLGRSYDPITSLFFALGCLLIASPYALFSKSLVLSFSATLGIFVYFGYLNQAFLSPVQARKSFYNKAFVKRVLQKGFTYLSSSLALSLASFLGTAYFVAVFFGKLSKVQFLTNLWVIPTVFVVFCLGYISCITFYIFPPLAATILKPVLGFFLEIISQTANIFGDSKYAFEINTELLSGIHIILYFGTAYMLYMTFKAIHDIKKERHLRAKRQDNDET